MKVNYHEILNTLDTVDANLCNLLTYAECQVNWHKIPNSKLEIMYERAKSLKVLVDDLFDRIENFAD